MQWTLTIHSHFLIKSDSAIPKQKVNKCSEIETFQIVKLSGRGHHYYHFIMKNFSHFVKTNKKSIFVNVFHIYHFHSRAKFLNKLRNSRLDILWALCVFYVILWDWAFVLLFSDASAATKKINFHIELIRQGLIIQFLKSTWKKFFFFGKIFSEVFVLWFSFSEKGDDDDDDDTMVGYIILYLWCFRCASAYSNER